MTESNEKKSTMDVAAASKCPVQLNANRETKQGGDSSAGGIMKSSYSVWNFWRPNKNSSDYKNTEFKSDMNINGSGEVAPTSSSACPVTNRNQQSNDRIQTASTILPFASPFSSQEHAVSHSQIPQPQQQIPLSTYRVVSSIPKPCPVGIETSSSENMVPSSSSASTPVVSLSKDQSSIPAHQPDFSEKWVYPSEQQFYNAMKRKGWDLPPGIEKSIPHVVRIHNAVNEKGWKEILEWERIRDPKNDNPRLVRFLGRPKDLSPRARFYSSLWLRNEPFDRHDWFVDRGDGTGQRRYVIDFYNGKENSGNNGLPSMYLDVRPALDDFEAVQDRVKMFFRNAFPGIVELVMNSSSSSSSSSSTTDSYGSKKERQDAGVMVDHHASPKGK
jgi:cytochrome c heme-lyase